MPTPSYTDFSSNKPDGATPPGTYSADDLANVRAMRDMVLGGRVKGFIVSRTQGTGPDVARPQYYTYMDASLSLGVRKKITWGGTGNYYPQSIEWEWSNDNGASWTTMGTAQAFTWDANDNVTATTNSGGFFTLLVEIWVKTLRAVANLAAHISGTGTGVHGLGSIATQPANNVAITGGAIDATPVGVTTPEVVRGKRVSEEHVSLSQPGSGGTVTIDWNVGGSFSFTAPASAGAAFTIAFSNLPASGIARSIVVEVTNGGGRTVTYPTGSKFPKGTAPTLTVTGVDVLYCYTRDGGTTLRWGRSIEDSK